MICSEYSRRGEEELYEGNGGHQRGWFGLKIRNRIGWFGLREISSLSELAFIF
jgi:hypothetical protein